jgi:hypothetical protein
MGSWDALGWKQHISTIGFDSFFSQSLHRLPDFVVSQVTPGTECDQIFGRAIHPAVVDVSDRQRANMRVEWLARESALSTALFAFPASGFFDLQCDLVPVVRIVFADHWHG